MKSNIIITCVVAGLAITAVGSADVGASGEAKAGAIAKSGTSGSNSSAALAGTAASEAQLKAILDNGARVSSEARASVDAKLAAEARKVDKEAIGKGADRVAARLAREFNTTADVIVDQQNDLDVSWGNLMIAHTLVANANTNVTVDQLVALRRDRAGWGQIGAGLGLRLSDLTRATQLEGRVALGLDRADGRVAAIHGEGARAGLSADATSRVGLGADRVNAGVAAGVGVRIGR